MSGDCSGGGYSGSGSCSLAGLGPDEGVPDGPLPEVDAPAGRPVITFVRTPEDGWILDKVEFKQAQAGIQAPAVGGTNGNVEEAGGRPRLTRIHKELGGAKRHQQYQDEKSLSALLSRRRKTKKPRPHKRVL